MIGGALGMPLHGEDKVVRENPFDGLDNSVFLTARRYAQFGADGGGGLVVG